MLSRTLRGSGHQRRGCWNVVVTDANCHEMRRTFDHLVVANRHYHYPHIPAFRGQEKWLQHDRRREILHSIFYREPQRYANQAVIVVGSRASGQDTASQIAPYALKVAFIHKSTFLAF